MSDINTGDITDASGIAIGTNAIGIVNTGNGTVIIQKGYILPPDQMLIPRKQWQLQHFIGRRQQQAQLKMLYTNVVQTQRGSGCFVTGRIGCGAGSVVQAAITDLLQSAAPILVNLTFDYTSDPRDTSNIPLNNYVAALCASLAPDQTVALRPLLSLLVGHLAARSLAVQQHLKGSPGLDPAQAVRDVLRLAVRERPVILLYDLDLNPPEWWLQFLDELINDHLVDLPLLLIATLETREPLSSGQLMQGVAARAQSLVEDGMATELRLPNLTEAELTEVLDDDAQLAELLWRYTRGWPVLTEQMWQAWQDYAYVVRTASGYYEITPAGNFLWSKYTDLFKTWFAEPWDQQPNRLCDSVFLERFLAFAALEGMEFTAEAAVEAAHRFVGGARPTKQPIQYQNIAPTDQLLSAIANWEEGTLTVECDVLMVYRDGNPQPFRRQRFHQEWIRLLLLHKIESDTKYPRMRMAAELAEVLSGLGGQHSVINRALFDLWLLANNPNQAKRSLEHVKAATPLDTLLVRIDLLARALQQQLRLNEKTTEGSNTPNVAPAEWQQLSEWEREAAEDYLERGELDRAHSMLTSALTHARAARSPLTEGSAFIILGRLVRIRQDHDLAASYLHQAEALFLSQSPRREAQLALASTVAELGIIASQQKLQEKARRLYDQACDIYSEVYGPTHPDTATSLSNLAFLLNAVGEYGAARPLYERALAIREQVLGPTHPHTAASLNNLAGVLKDVGEYGAARPLYERALAIHEQVLGPTHPHTATLRNNLAILDAKMTEQNPPQAAGFQSPQLGGFS